MKWLNEQRTKVLLMVIMSTILFFFPWNEPFSSIVLIYLCIFMVAVGCIEMIEHYTHCRK
jgi:hypothetical protein